MSTFKINRSDLDFLLRQVTIGIDYSQLINALDPGGLREVSGSNNNLVGSSVGTPGPFVPGPYTTIGQADQEFLRLSQTSYNPTGPDAAYATLGNRQLRQRDRRHASPRLESRLDDVHDRALCEPCCDRSHGGFLPGWDAAHSLTPTSPSCRLPACWVAAGTMPGSSPSASSSTTASTSSRRAQSGTITIEIMPGDPLYVDPVLRRRSEPGYVPGVSNVMRVSRANLANPDSDFVSGDGTGALIAGVTPIYKNNTGLLIDQSQTYGSHESMNAFLREYSATGTPTGRLVTGSGDANGDLVTDGLATWADVKANALKIGIVLTDQDVFDAPMLKVDATGKLLFTPDPTDTWDTTTAFTGSDPNDPFMRNPDGTVMRTNQAFLIDINPAADPNFPFDGPGYDAALLNAHYITGDGRANENFALTAVHHVFHEEHNFQLENIKAGILATGRRRLHCPVANGSRCVGRREAVPGCAPHHRVRVQPHRDRPVCRHALWRAAGVRVLFDRHQHGCQSRVQPGRVPPRPLDADRDVQGRHRIRTAHGTFSDVPLLQAFLNPTAFADLGPAAITAGLVRTYGNEVDEFITPALQQSLLGQPLDLAAINIARGRDVGLPTHNELRQQIYDGLLQYTNNSPNSSALAPYTSWQDYGDHLRHPGTLVNMIAAYARDVGDAWGIEDARAAYLAGTGTLDAIRDAAQAVVDAYANGSDPDHAAAVTFMQGTPTFNPGTGQWEFTGGDQGFWDVDLWIGGLAERPLFDGPLGTTFSYILLDFAQRQQDGDRFYYLYRTPMGTHLGNEIIANHFTDLVMRATGLEHLNGDVFITPDAVFELMGHPHYVGRNDLDINDFFDASTQTITYVDGTRGPGQRRPSHHRRQRGPRLHQGRPRRRHAFMATTATTP